MAKRKRKGGMTKSQSIRDYAAAHPGEGPTAITAGLKGQGVGVTPQFVSTILSNAKRRSGGRRGRRRRGRPPGAVSNGVSLQSLKAAKKFVRQLGDVKSARAAVDMFAQLLD